MSARSNPLEQVMTGWQQRDQWPHALLLSGASSSALLDLGRKLAKTRLCVSGNHCDACDSCRVFDSGNHLDFHLLASSVTAEELDLRYIAEGPATTRRLIRKEQIASTLRQLALHARRANGWRVLLLVHPEELHSAAANALLKSLEEPGDRVFFILISAQPRAVLETIISRCQQLALPPPSRDELTHDLTAQGVQVSCAHTLAELRRRGLNWDVSDLEERRPLVVNWLSALADQQEHQRLLALDRLGKDHDPDQIIEVALSLTLDLMRLQSGMQAADLTHSDLADDLMPLAPAGPWLDLAQTLAAARPALRRNVRLTSLLMGATI
jgi:hypothetical protein